MTDELTPEEKAALESLPRERMPVGLEERVVGAMREHGFLAKRRRTFTVTNSRMAGVLAASVALMIGAYSIGLHRGGGNTVLPPETTLQKADRYLAEMPAETPASKKVAGERADEAERPATEAVPESKTPSTTLATPPAGSDEGEKSLAREAVAEEKATVSVRGGRGGTAPPEQGSLSAQGKLSKSSEAPRTPAASSLSLSNQPRTFFLNGSPVLVEAPDSVRIIQDDQGRMLIIYTSDGIIRIRLAD